MKEVLIFGGTTEGRSLSEYLAEAGIAHTICVATEYGEQVLKEHPLVTVQRGRMQEEEIRTLIKAKDYVAVVDATHPYAEVITQNIKAAVKLEVVPYYRLQREMTEVQQYEKLCYFESHEECALALEDISGNILLTTGSKELVAYTSKKILKSRLYIRVIPSIESIRLCQEKGISGKQILALQGPFSSELNEAILKQYNIACMVTKESGKNGGFSEKIQAAQNLNIPIYVISNTKKKDGLSFTEICKELDHICQRSSKKEKDNIFEIILAGTGMGSNGNLTKEVEQEIVQADILLGAERIICNYEPKLEKKPYYLASQIIPYLKKQQVENAGKRKKVVILFSGDSGFYSGCEKLYQSLKQEIKREKLDATIQVLPGISSVSYLSASTGVSYHDAAIRSIHGKQDWEQDILVTVKQNAKTFLLTSGVKDIQSLGRLFLENGLEQCVITAGYQLSYPEEEFFELSAEMCCKLTREGLYTCLIQNSEAKTKLLTHGKADEDFIRDKIPMTKEEVREVSICKLRLQEDSVLYDIGSGTGSIAVEVASLSERVRVYAIERKKEAVSLIGQNCNKFSLKNVTVIETFAPGGLEELPMPTHVFIGGSGGNMKELMTVLYEKNPKLRVVMNAISMETICEIREVIETHENKIKDLEIVQLQVSKAKKAGDYHLLQAQNPVWICSFNFM